MVPIVFFSEYSIELYLFAYYILSVDFDGNIVEPGIHDGCIHLATLRRLFGEQGYGVAHCWYYGHTYRNP